MTYTSIVIYTRTSTDRQELGHDAQEFDCQRWAQKRGIKVVGVYSDTLSGSTPVDQRDGFLSAVDALESGSALLMWRRDRLGRDVMINAIAESLVERVGGKVLTLDIGDSDGPEADLMKTIIDACAAFELALIKKRTRVALAARKAQGLITGSAPLGMKSDDKGHLIPNDLETQAIELARSLRKSGLTLQKVVEELRTRGIKSRRGETPSMMTISRWCKGIKLNHPTKGMERTNHVARKVAQSDLVIDKVLSLRTQGLSFRKVAVYLSERYPEIKTSKGLPLHHTQIRRIVQRAS